MVKETLSAPRGKASWGGKGGGGQKGVPLAPKGQQPPGAIPRFRGAEGKLLLGVLEAARERGRARSPTGRAGGATGTGDCGATATPEHPRGSVGHPATGSARGLGSV